MKRMLLASAACLALSLPAMALTNGSQANPPPQQTQNQQQSQAANQRSTNQQAEMIKPSTLNKTQIRDLQLSLNKDGYSTGHVDGIWGPDTRDAVINFQKAKNLPGKGELNQQTLADLGVNLNNQSQATANQNGQAIKSNEPSQASRTKEPNAVHQNNMASTSNHNGSMGAQGSAKAKTP